jgi:hypothetical protein
LIFIDLYSDKLSPAKVAEMTDNTFTEKVFCLCGTCAVSNKNYSHRFHSTLHPIFPVTLSEGRYMSVQKLNKAGI